MKFLDVFDTAGTASLLGRDLTDMGHEVKVLQLRQLDPFGFGDYYKNVEWFDTAEQLIARAKQLESWADHITVHDFAQYLTRFKTPNIFYHGSMLKHTFAETDIDRDCKRVFLMMPHMIKYRPMGTAFDILIDTKLFTPRPLGKSKLCITNERNLKLTKDSLPLDVGIRVRENCIIPYGQMPDFLANYGEYWEARYDYAHPPQPIPDMSGTALQCLAMGMGVNCWGKWHDKFPEESDSVYFAKKFLRCFE